MRRLVVASFVMVILTAQAALAGFSTSPLVTGPEDQFGAASNASWVGFTSNTTETPHKYHPFVQPVGGGSPTKLNASGTRGFFGDFEDSGNVAIFQQISGTPATSDIYTYDLDNTPHRAPLSAINTVKWEFSPRVSTGYILFLRENNNSSLTRLWLYDRNAHTFTKLREFDGSRVSIDTGDVGSQWASWYVCSTTCNVWIYDIVGESFHKVPTQRLQYSPVVDEVNGFVYFVRSGSGCGNDVRIRRAPIGSLGASTVVLALPDGFDTGRLSIEVDGANLDLIYDRLNCGAGSGNIYEVLNIGPST
jgi:hypothetical protein